MPQGKFKKIVKGERSLSSRSWLQRQLNDPYVQAAKRDGLISRAAYKLLQIDEKLHLLRPGTIVADLGAAPGGWSRVAVRAGARVIAVDLLPLKLPEGEVHFVQGDFSDEAIQGQLRALAGGPLHGVLSDMAPNTIGHAATDHLRIAALADAAMEFAREMLRPGGFFVCKMRQGGADADMMRALKRDYACVRHIKPAASRAESAETYLAATGFRGLVLSSADR